MTDNKCEHCERLQQRLQNQTERAALLGHLVGCTIQALESYDVDDGLNTLVLAGIVSEYKQIEAAHDEEQQPKTGVTVGK